MSDQPSQFAQVVERMIAIRDKRDEYRREYEAKDNELKEQFARGEAWLMDHLNKAGVDSMKCAAGTVFAKENTSAGVADWPALAEFVRETGEVDLLEHRVSKTAVREYQDAHGGNLPPGVQTRSERVVQVRRATSK